MSQCIQYNKYNRCNTAIDLKDRRSMSKTEKQTFCNLDFHNILSISEIEYTTRV